MTVTKSKIPTFSPLQVHTSNAFHTFFTEINLEAILNFMIMTVLPFHFEQIQGAKNDELIERGEEKREDAIDIT